MATLQQEGHFGWREWHIVKSDDATIIKHLDTEIVMRPERRLGSLQHSNIFVSS